MFTGIVQMVGKINGIEPTHYGVQLRTSTSRSFANDLKVGASVSVDGVCLSVVKLDQEEITFDAVYHTLANTNLRDRAVGDPINLERSARFGDEIGGHLVSGHVSTVGTIVGIETDGSDNFLQFTVDPYWAKYISLRGFIALDGASLTVAEVDRERAHFRVALIPETIRSTAFRRYKAGERINVEIEHQTKVVVDAVLTAMEGATRR